MSDLTNTFEEELYEAVRSDTPFLALFTVAPTETTNGTEVTGGSYARQAITLAAYGAGSGGGSNSAQINFPTASGSWGTIVAIGIFDAVSGGTLKFYKTVANFAVASGESVRVDVGALTVSFN